jgi:hypothetical protein
MKKVYIDEIRWTYTYVEVSINGGIPKMDGLFHGKS